MKSNKIIIVFTIMIIAMLSGYFIYNHYQKINLAQFYYDNGDYSKASELKTGNISDKSRMLNLAKNWTNDLNSNEDLYIDIMLISSEIDINKGKDDVYVDKLEVYYQSIADHFNVSTSRLDEIGEMNSEEGTLVIKNLR